MLVRTSAARFSCSEMSSSRRFEDASLPAIFALITARADSQAAASASFAERRSLARSLSSSLRCIRSDRLPDAAYSASRSAFAFSSAIFASSYSASIDEERSCNRSSVVIQAEISRMRRSSRRSRYCFAFSDCSFSGPTCNSSSSILSWMRKRFSSVRSRRRSASSLR